MLAELEVLPVRYHRLFDAFVTAARGDERVRAVWLGGSFARGVADAASDLDFLVAVTDESFDEWTGSWRAWIDAVTPTAYAEAHAFAPGMYFAASSDCARFDITVERVGGLAQTFFPNRLPVFDRDGLHAVLPEATPGPGPSVQNLERLVREWFRVTAMPEVIVTRDDWLLANEHLHLLRDLIRQVFLEVNAPVPVTGVKHWSSKLTPEQQRALLVLPTSLESVPELVDAHVACSRTFLAAARPLAADLGMAWPTALEAAATEHLRHELGIADPYPI